MPITALTLESRLLAQIAPDDVERFYQLLTEADERLLRAGRWAWTREQLVLVPELDCVTLPAGYESIVGCRLGSVAKSVGWQEIEYLEDGPGLIPVQSGCGRLVDQGINDEGLRVYKLTDSTVEEVTVLARKAPVEITTPSGIPRCQSFGALKNAMYAIVYEENNDLERAMGYLKMAIESLNREELAYRGSAKTVFKPSMFGPLSMRGHCNFP